MRRQTQHAGSRYRGTDGRTASVGGRLVAALLAVTVLAVGLVAASYPAASASLLACFGLVSVAVRSD